MVMDRPITRVPRVSRVALSADHQIQTDSATPHYRIHQYWLTGGLFFSGWLLPVDNEISQSSQYLEKAQESPPG